MRIPIHDDGRTFTSIGADDGWPAPTEPDSDEINRVDADLLGKAADDADADAFAELLRRTGPTIFGLLGKMLPPWQIDDAYSEISLKYWKFRKRFCAAKGSVRRWFKTIARNHARDILRRRPAQVGAAGRETALPDIRHPDPAHAAEQAEAFAILRERVDRILATCPAYVQTSFRLQLDGHDLQSIAELVGHPIGSIGGGLSRFRQKLRAHLNETHPTSFITEHFP